MVDLFGVLLAMVGLLLLALFIYTVILYNGFILLKNNIGKAWGNIDVLLKQRHDEVPNLVAVVQGYAAFEKKVLEDVTKARSASVGAQSVHDKAQAGAGLSSALGNLFVVAEKYPDLKASENFLALQKRLTGLENEIADRREFYNDSVTAFNMRLEQFPDLFVARVMGLKARELFSASGQEREVVAVKVSPP